MKKLNELITCPYDIEIHGIKIDSRKVQKKDLFVAVEGYNIDHSIYIEDAIKNGAAAIITNKKRKEKVPIIQVEDVNQTLIDICKRFYDYQEKMDLIGITGTDGKTTTATILKELLTIKEKTAYMGTNGIKVGNSYQKTENTTPSIEDIYKYLSSMEKEECKTAVLEVSSEAILHKRIETLKFKYIIYTNITEDHLNIHKTVKNYRNIKNRFVNYLKENGTIIVNKDDINCQKMTIDDNLSTITYGKDKKSDYRIHNLVEKNDTIEFDLTEKNKTHHIISPFMGEYNVYNLVAAMIVCQKEKIPMNQIQERLLTIGPVPGRRENLKFGQEYTIILDYAHTENGIKTVVESFKPQKKRIIVVTGSAGGREKEKRKKIGSYLLNNVEKVVFTMDDPRYEKVDDIIDQMIGKEMKKNYKRIVDRKEAIEYVLDNATKDDIILILGKGRDTYMAIEDRREKYSDYEVMKNYFK